MERRVFLAILLSFSVLFTYQLFVAPAPKPPVPTPTEQTPAASTPGATVAAPAADANNQAPGAAALVADTEARDVTVETDTVRAVFNTRGAVLKSWRLKKYPGDDGQPLDLVPVDLPASEARPFSLKTGDAAVDQTLATALFKPSDVATASAGTSPSVTFEYRDASGLSARKQFVFNAGHPYVTQLTAAVERNGEKMPFQIAFGPSLGSGYNAA